MRTIIFFLMIAFTVFISGCGHYIIASKIVATTKNVAPPEIVETPTYRSEVAKIRTVAVRAPSSCSNKTSDQQQGSAVSKEVVLRTDCAVEMSIIERALTKASYKVISWTELERGMGKNLSAHQVADSLGAQILFQVNSLEKSTRSFGKIGKDEKLEYFYFNSNDNGDMLDEKVFDAETREYMKRTFFDTNKQIIRVKIPFVTLDANAISIKDGEAIWFYRWTNSDPSAVDFVQKFFISCKSSTLCSIHDSPKKKKSDKDMVSKESESSSTNDQPEDKNAAVYSILLNSVIDNFVKSFSTPK